MNTSPSSLTSNTPTTNWTGAIDNNWANSSHWDAGIPLQSHQVMISSAPSHSFTLNQLVMTNNTRINNGPWTIILPSPGEDTYIAPGLRRVARIWDYFPQTFALLPEEVLENPNNLFQINKPIQTHTPISSDTQESLLEPSVLNKNLETCTFRRYRGNILCSSMSIIGPGICASPLERVQYFNNNFRRRKPITNDGTLIFTKGTNDDQVEITSPIAGNGNIIKKGSNKLIVSIDQFYTGATTIESGVLAVHSTIASNAVWVEKNGTLTGGGILSGTVINSGIFTPDYAVNSITVKKDYIQHPDGRAIFTFTSDTDYYSFRRVLIGGTAYLNGTLKLAFNNGYIPCKGDEFTLLTANQGIIGKFNSVDSEGYPVQVIYSDSEVKVKFI